MEGRELRRSYTQIEFSPSHRNFRPHYIQQVRPRKNQGGVIFNNNNNTPNNNNRMKFPTIEIYRPPGQRQPIDSSISSNSLHSMNNSASTSQNTKLNVHAKEFVMNHNSLQTSKSTGNVMVSGFNNTMDAVKNQEINRKYPLFTKQNNFIPNAGFALQHSKTSILHRGPPSPQIKSSHISWNEKTTENEKANNQGQIMKQQSNHLKRSKSMISTIKPQQFLNNFQQGILKSSSSDTVTHLGPMPKELLAIIQQAVKNPDDCSSADIMQIARQLVERTVEGRQFAGQIAHACSLIIDRESKETFLEALMNHCQYIVEKIKSINNPNKKFNGLMAFFTELYLAVKHKQFDKTFGVSGTSPTHILLTQLAKCGHEILRDSNLCSKAEQVESLFLMMSMVGKDIENEVPKLMDALICSIRDTLLKANTTDNIRHTLLQIIEIHASKWQLPAFTLLYYKNNLKT